jgi:ankyrin repeat protein
VALYLLDHGANPNQSGAGRTPLHAAVQRVMPNLAKALLARGANPNARTERAMPLVSRSLGEAPWSAPRRSGWRPSTTTST